MATIEKGITKEWQKVCESNISIVLQNTGIHTIEVGTVTDGDPTVGFIVKPTETFSYPGNDEVWVRSKYGCSKIIIDTGA